MFLKSVLYVCDSMAICFYVIYNWYDQQAEGTELQEL